MSIPLLIQVDIGTSDRVELKLNPVALLIAESQMYQIRETAKYLGIDKCLGLDKMEANNA